MDTLPHYGRWQTVLRESNVQSYVDKALGENDIKVDIKSR